MADNEQAAAVLKDISALARRFTRPLRFMEVCGTHTVAIFRSGIRRMLPENIRLVSGPGCPVCVTPEEYIDQAVAYAEQGAIIATFGDMLKVPGNRSSLSVAQAAGGRVEIVYSPLDSLRVAKDNPTDKVIFLAVGFETTSPATAAAILAAQDSGLDNLYFLAAPKLVPPALTMLLSDPEVKVDGFLLPGHVAMVTGAKAFAFLPEQYNVPAVVAGFSALSILRSVCELTRQKVSGQATLSNEYQEVVTADGNTTAQNTTAEVYEPCDANWRGIGIIPQSGLRIREKYAARDITKIRPIMPTVLPNKTACRCGEVLKGLIEPTACPLFDKTCVPEHAVGPCMVSVEGVCAAWHRYSAK